MSCTGQFLALPRAAPDTWHNRANTSGTKLSDILRGDQNFICWLYKATVQNRPLIVIRPGIDSRYIPLPDWGDVDEPGCGLRVRMARKSFVDRRSAVIGGTGFSALVPAFLLGS